jgi:hypothetical protein
VIVTLDSGDHVGHGYGGEAEGDTLVDIENLIGSKYDDGLFGDDQANILAGNGGNDVLKGFGGADYLDGGDDVDTASYDGSPSGVTVSLLANFAKGGDAEGDTFNSIENLIGSDHIDWLEGATAAIPCAAASATTNYGVVAVSTICMATCTTMSSMAGMATTICSAVLAMTY